MLRWVNRQRIRWHESGNGRDYGPGMKPQMSRRSQQARGNVQNSIRMTMHTNTE
jgi:hypothetical protein